MKNKNDFIKHAQSWREINHKKAMNDDEQDTQKFMENSLTAIFIFCLVLITIFAIRMMIIDYNF